MVKVQRASADQHMITIPKELRKAMGWEKGDQLEFKVKDSKTLELKKKDWERWTKSNRKLKKLLSNNFDYVLKYIVKVISTA